MRSSSLPAFTAAPNCFKILPSSLLYPGMSSSLCNHGIDTHGHRASCRYSPSRHETTGETSKNPFGIFHHFIDHFARVHLQCLSNLHKQIQTRRSITKLQRGYVAFRNANPICKFLLREPRRITAGINVLASLSSSYFFFIPPRYNAPLRNRPTIVVLLTINSRLHP